MEIRIGGPVPMRFVVNGFMLAGMIVGAVGVAGWAAEAFGLYPEGKLAGDLSRLLTLLGMALYFLGRIVQMLAWVRKNRG